MATSKTLAPTNVTINIPEFTDQPDQRVNSNCIDKEADAINALSSKFTDTPAVTDLDSALNNNTIYRFNTGASHNPGYNYGLVFVMAEGNNVKQLAVDRGGTGAGTISIRSRSSSSTWGDWQQLAPYKAGTFTPKLYDYETYVRDLPSADYVQIGKFVVMSFVTSSANLSGISTMMQIRNLPVDWIIGGNMYLSGLSGEGGNHTIQMSNVGGYFRPNIISSQIANASSTGVFSFNLFGWKT